MLPTSLEYTKRTCVGVFVCMYRVRITIKDGVTFDTIHNYHLLCCWAQTTQQI